MPLPSGAVGGYPGGTGVAIGSQQVPPAPASYSGTFIPEIWSGKLIEKFYDATVMAAIANTDYEGEIKNQGDTIHIRQRPDIVIEDYTPDTELEVHRPNAPTVDLTIDYAKYFNAIADDVYAIQSDMDLLGMWAEDASESMKVTIDRELLTTVVLGGAKAVTNRGLVAGRISGSIDLGVTGTPVLVVKSGGNATNTDIVDLIVDMGTVLDEQNIPETGRWLIIPAWLAGLIKKSDLKDASLTGDSTSIVRNGRLGMIDRFTLYMSNLLPAGVAGGLAAGETAIFAGHSMAVTFASQLTKMETMKSERTFGELIRGLQVYGCDVIKSEGLAEAIVKKAPAA